MTSIRFGTNVNNSTLAHKSSKNLLVRFGNTANLPGENPDMLLAEVLIHLDMDADRNKTKPNRGTLQPGIGRIHKTEGLIERINAVIASPNNQSESIQVLQEIAKIVGGSKSDYGQVPVNIGVYSRGVAAVEKALGQQWVKALTQHMLRTT